MIVSRLISTEYVACLIALLLFIIYRGKEKANLQIYRICYWNISFLAVCSLFNIFLYSLSKIEAHAQLISFALIPYEITVMGLQICFTIYILCLANVRFNYYKRWIVILFLPSVIVLAMVASSPATNLVYKVMENGNIENGSMYYVNSILNLYYVFLWMFIAVFYRKLIGKKNFIYITQLIIFSLGICVVEYMLLKEYLITLPTALCLTLMIFSIKKPGEILDPTNAMRYAMFKRDIASDFSMNNSVTIYFLKLDEYEMVNESFGENLTNQLLVQFTTYLYSLNKKSAVYRVSKDIYLLRLVNANAETIEKVESSMLKRFSEKWESPEMSLYFPVGICKGNLPEEVLSQADYQRLVSNMKDMKFQTDRLYAYSDILNNEEEKILKAVRKAMDNNSFKVFYQPIYSTEKKTIVAAEALIRLIDDEIGFVSPEVFIPLAEKHGYILKIGKFVFKEVCRFYSENKLADKGVEYIEVNLSGVQMMQDKLAEEFTEIMSGWRVGHSRINFEITETSAMQESEAVHANIDYFTTSNIELSLDDYGTGYSNMSYLYTVPFSIIKVDKSILWAADNNARADIVLKNTVQMANRLNMKVVCEGVETEQHIEKLLDYGCHYFQGYYFSKPVCEMDFLNYVDNFTVPEVCLKN